MRVLYVSKALGVAAYRDKIRALRRRVDVTAVIPESWRPPAEPVQDGDLITWPVRFPGRAHVHVYRDPGRLLDQQRPDLLHVDEEPYSAVTWQLIRAARERRVPAVFFAWQTIAKRLPPPFGWTRRYVFRHARRAIAGTARAGETLRRLGYPGPMTVVPQFGVDPDRFRPSQEHRRSRRAEWDVAPDQMVIGFAGRLVHEKGVHCLVQAINAYAGNGERYREPPVLVVLGDGPERGALTRLASRSGLDGRIRFEGHQPSSDMPSWLAGLDVLVLPSLTTRGWTEQFGRVLVEAMACGVTVVGSDSGEIPGVIGDAGVVVPEGQVAALTETLVSLAAQPDRRARLGALGRERVTTHFSNEVVAKHTVEFYHQVLGHA